VFHEHVKICAFKLHLYKLVTEIFVNWLGVILRDSHGVAQVRHITGNKILRILKAMGLASNIPEDLYCLIKKAVSIRKHLERNRKVYMYTNYINLCINYNFIVLIVSTERLLCQKAALCGAIDETVGL